MALSGIQAIQSRISAIESTFVALNGAGPNVASVGTATVTPAHKPAAKSAQEVALAAALAEGTPTKTAATSDFYKLFAAKVAPKPTLGGSWPKVSDQVNRWQNTIKVAGAKHRIDPNLLAAMAQVESGGDPKARSAAGAVGIMQLMPGTARELGVNPLDPTSSIDGAARLMRKYTDRFGSVESALAAYNAGPGAVMTHGGVPPYSETQQYVQKVTQLVKGTA